MKKLLREVSRAIVSNRYLWHAIRKTLGRCWALLEAERRGAEGYRLVHGSVLSEGDLVRKLSASGEVLGGPFKGMQYGQIISYGSVLPPKILGFYESEISVVFQNLKCKKFDVIIDIGSAEGYYAVGLARMNKAQLVYAFDINS